MKMIFKEYMVDKTMIGFIKFIFEAHDGVAVSSTLDAKSGHIRLAIALERMGTAQKIITDLKKDFHFNEV
jgi:hypothetical protein